MTDKPQIIKLINVDDGSVRYLPLLSDGTNPDLPTRFIDFPPCEAHGYLDRHFRYAATQWPERYADWSRGEPKATEWKHFGIGRPMLRFREPAIKSDWLFV